MAGSGNDQVQIIRGLPFPKGLFKKENIEAALDHVPWDTDIIMGSYPKTGSTWLQYIVLQILSKGELFPSFNEVEDKYAPFIEMVGVQALDGMKEPRVYKHHIPYNMVQKNEKSKVLYTYRHPEDAFVSFYHFSQNFAFVPVPFDDFFENYIIGNIGYGRCFEHVLSFYEHRLDGNLLMISYEQLKANPKDGILRIAKFLGEEHYECLSENEEVMAKVLEHTSFEYMKKNLELFLSLPAGEETKTKKIEFFRKGTVGDGKKVLSAEQRERIKAEAKKVLAGTEILKEWYDE
ncbi:sulfotransferase 1B1-like [Uloborus diversus]|uniref:sulfotransferase 1B1-like n=1 Tax=Uloborus diversus TaxID=327109 RepID=UPI002409CCAF|nr:sulfotransferase 1B1-like [Uloborus diversus]